MIWKYNFILYVQHLHLSGLIDYVNIAATYETKILFTVLLVASTSI